MFLFVIYILSWTWIIIISWFCKRCRNIILPIVVSLCWTYKVTLLYFLFWSLEPRIRGRSFMISYEALVWKSCLILSWWRPVCIFLFYIFTIWNFWKEHWTITLFIKILLLIYCLIIILARTWIIFTREKVIFCFVCFKYFSFCFWRIKIRCSWLFLYFLILCFITSWTYFVILNA